MATNNLDIGVVQSGSIDIGVVQSPNSVTSTQSITAKARIGQISTKTLTSKASIALSSSQTITSKARISATSTQSLTSKGRIAGTTSQTITAKGRIGFFTTQDLTAKGKIQSIVSKDLTAKGSISVISTRTITAKGNISGTTGKTITAKALIVPNISVCQDFESYPLGAFLGPFPTGFETIGTPVIASGGPDSSSRYLQFLNSAYVFNPGFWMSRQTLLFNYQVISGQGFPDGAPAFIFRDTDGTSSHDLVSIRILGDGSFALQLGDTSFASFSPTGFHQNQWYWLQFNVLITQVFNPITVRDEIWIEASAYIDGEELFPSVFVFSSYLPAQLFGFGYNRIILQSPGAGVGSGLDNYCIRGYTTSIIYPNPGSPNVRVSNAFIEVPELPTTSQVRIAQASIEIPELPTTSRLRVAQAFIELLTLPTVPTPQPTPPVPTPFLGRPSCTVQITYPSIPTVVPVLGQPSPPVPPGPPTRTCTPQKIGQL